MDFKIKRGRGLGDNSEVYIYAYDYDDIWAYSGGFGLLVIPGLNLDSEEPLFYFKWNGSGMPLFNQGQDLFEIKKEEEGLYSVKALPDVFVEIGKQYKLFIMNY